MKTRLLAAFVVTLLLAACGGGNGDDGDVRAPDETARSTAAADSPLDPSPPEGVELAPQGKINRPQEGEYGYTLVSKSTNAATPDAPPRTSPPDAEWSSKVTYDGGVVITEDRASLGSAVATTRRQWTKDAVEEISFETKTEQGTSGCRFDVPVAVLPIPIEERKLPKHTFEGEGQNCTGERTITIERRDTVKDENGHAWPTWQIRVETVVKSTGLTNRTTDTRWFSPDLGKEVRAQGIAEHIDPSGKVAARAESRIVLESYPT